MKMANSPAPVKRPDSVGAIQGMDREYPVQPNQNSPIANSAPPTMTGGSRHSGTGMPPFACSFLT